MLMLHKRAKLDFGYLMIMHTTTTKELGVKTFPYGKMLTRIFRHFNIKLAKKKIKYSYSKKTFTNMGIVRVDGVWKYKKKLF